MLNFNGLVLTKKCIYGIVAIIVLVILVLIATGGTYGYKKYLSIIKDYRDKDAALRVYEAEYKMLLNSIEQKKQERKNIKPPADIAETRKRLKELGYESR